VTDIDKARMLGRRVFYERSTGTLRMCPQNYCLAARRRDKAGGLKWHAFVDGALKEHEPRVCSILAAFQDGSTGDALAGLLGDYFEGEV